MRTIHALTHTHHTHAELRRLVVMPSIAKEHTWSRLTHPEWILTCNIFMRMTSSEEGSVPTNLACVTASAMFSMAAPAVSTTGSEIKEHLPEWIFLCYDESPRAHMIYPVKNEWFTSRRMNEPSCEEWMNHLQPKWIALCLKELPWPSTWISHLVHEWITFSITYSYIRVTVMTEY